MKSNQKRMTDRQYDRWPEAVREVDRHLNPLGTYVADSPDDWRWLFRWDEEARPGRGRDFTAVFLDGEHVATVRMDPYGSWNVATGEVDWQHNDSDDECSCDPCTEQRRIEEERWRRR